MGNRTAGFLAAVLRRGAGENASDLSDQGSAGPQVPGPIEKFAYLRRHGCRSASACRKL
jgi:hypothetical protein